MHFASSAAQSGMEETEATPGHTTCSSRLDAYDSRADAYGSRMDAYGGMQEAEAEAALPQKKEEEAATRRCLRPGAASFSFSGLRQRRVGDFGGRWLENARRLGAPWPVLSCRECLAA